jgi:hypothetical protein
MLGEILTLAHEQIGPDPLPQLCDWFRFLRNDRKRKAKPPVENLGGVRKFIWDGDLQTWLNRTVRKPPQSEPLPVITLEDEIRINEQFLELLPEHPQNDELRERTAMLRRQLAAQNAGARAAGGAS